MKSIMFCIGMVIYIGFAMADSAKTLQFNAVIDQQTLHECDILAVSIVVHEQKKFISISLTRAGTKKATNFLRANKGKKWFYFLEMTHYSATSQLTTIFPRWHL